MPEFDESAHDRIRNRADYRAFLAADLRAHGIETWHWWMFLTHPELNYQRLLRRAELWQLAQGPARLFYLFARVRLARASVMTGISIPPGVFGRGLSIAHYGSIVVNDNVRVGAFCRIHSGTNIGVGRDGVPCLGDFVYVAPGAVLSGGIRVGSCAAIGANAVVRQDVPDGAVVGGVPARVLSQSTSFEAMPVWIQKSMIPTKS